MHDTGGNMYKLKIVSNKCILCGTCEILLPDLLAKTKGDGLLITDNNVKKHATEIWRAIFSCQSKALSLEKYYRSTIK